MKLYGYVRQDGKIGFRNHVLVIPSVICATETALRIAQSVNGAVALYNQHGCVQLEFDLRITMRTLIGLGKNPNVASVLVVSLGCESASPEKIADEIAKTGKRTELVKIQDLGGTLKTVEKGVRLAKEMVEGASRIKKEEVNFRDVVLAIECGGSDITSGIVANPVSGYVADKVVDLGGTVIFSETPEMIGAEHTLAKRAISKEVADEIYKIVSRWEKKAIEAGVDMRGTNPTPGNIRGGITTIEEKSLGAIIKGGTKPIQGVLEYGEQPSNKGLYIMDTPGQDVESMVGMVAGGAQIILFTTGLGTPTGNPIAPVIKITGNPRTYAKMKDNTDFNAGTIIEGAETIEQAGKKLFNLMVEVLNGKLTKAEVLSHREFGLHKALVTF